MLLNFIFAFIFMFGILTLLDPSSQYLDWSQVFRYAFSFMDNWVMLLLVFLVSLPFAVRYVIKIMDGIK